jgi:hypothetical protein
MLSSVFFATRRGRTPEVGCQFIRRGYSEVRKSLRESTVVSQLLQVPCYNYVSCSFLSSSTRTPAPV